MLKNLPTMQETHIWSLGREETLEKEMATHSSIFEARRAPTVMNLFFLFNWRIITLQCSVHFCHTTWVSHYVCVCVCVCVCVYPLSWACLPPPVPSPLVHHGAPGWAPCVYSNFPLAICFTYGQVYVLMVLFQFIPPSLSPDCVHKSALYICASSYTAEERVIEK